MQYLLTIWMEETDFVPTPEAMAPWAAFNNEAAAAHQLPRHGGNSLHHQRGLGSGSGQLRGFQLLPLGRLPCYPGRPAQDRHQPYVYRTRSEQ